MDDITITLHTLTTLLTQRSTELDQIKANLEAVEDINSRLEEDLSQEQRDNSLLRNRLDERSVGEDHQRSSLQRTLDTTHHNLQTQEQFSSFLLHLMYDSHQLASVSAYMQIAGPYTARNKIGMIRCVRNLTGCGLLEAKMLVEGWVYPTVNHAPTQPAPGDERSDTIGDIIRHKLAEREVKKVSISAPPSLPRQQDTDISNLAVPVPFDSDEMVGGDAEPTYSDLPPVINPDLASSAFHQGPPPLMASLTPGMCPVVVEDFTPVDDDTPF